MCIGSCSSSYAGSDDRGRDPEETNSISGSEPCKTPGSRQVLAMPEPRTARSPPCWTRARAFWKAPAAIGMGQSPNSAGVSLRTFNRNPRGRSGTQDASVCISPETRLWLPDGVYHRPHLRACGRASPCRAHQRQHGGSCPPLRTNMKRRGAARAEYQTPARGAASANTMELPTACWKVGDNILQTISLPRRQQDPALPQQLFRIWQTTALKCDPEFPARAMAAEGGFIVGRRQLWPGLQP